MCPDIMYRDEIQLPKKELQMMPLFWREKKKKSDKKIGTFSAKAFKALKAWQPVKRFLGKGFFTQFCLST